jgi:hypothetical protein
MFSEIIKKVVCSTVLFLQSLHFVDHYNKMLMGTVFLVARKLCVMYCANINLCLEDWCVCSVH